MIIKRVSAYEEPELANEPFFHGEPEACPASRQIASFLVEGREPTADDHERLWKHVETCPLCLRNVVRVLANITGGVPLPIPISRDEAADMVAMDKAKRGVSN